MKAKGITKIEDLEPLQEGICLWQGDITAIECGAIVNAANSGMTGCYVPNHACINMGEAYAPKEIEAKSICINEDIGRVLKQI
ncbi:hypothetical protein [Hespellia stercorisuis]|uniref:Macro domain-containing protein n=1 Tax=Hespellia stercorisuis DSM 15480 TaxID=1121950 RepID=A0A1M6W734_9FIRM|nr:hypothetical protein [Hespellia stercorisuis]SHK89584.1 hypothetical protein SAMN02745243_03951 [Hespellia stercorisuis DSM 15480]